MPRILLIILVLAAPSLADPGVVRDEVICRADVGDHIRGMRVKATTPGSAVKHLSRKIAVVSFHGLLPSNQKESVLRAEAEFIQAKNRSAGKKITCDPNYRFRLTATPNDPGYSSLWGMTKISAPQAWDQSTGSRSVLVAVIDSGMQLNHPDLQANLSRNSGETSGNGIDDDGNGYVDDVNGFDFANNDSNPSDDNNHGTHVSGTIGAVGNNGAGVAGVSWAISLLPVKVVAGDGTGTLLDIALGIDYARTRGAQVMNLSLGSEFNLSVLQQTLQQAANAGVVLVFAAGNESANNDTTPSYPANYLFSSSLTVAATNQTDGIPSFSNFGRNTVHLGAPGVGILSTVIGGYNSFQGTSMAAPHVAGAAALLRSANSSLTGAQIKQCLVDSIDPVSALASKSISGGRLNLGAAMTACGSGPAPTATPTAAPGIPTATPVATPVAPTPTPNQGGGVIIPAPPTLPIVLEGSITAKQRGKTRISISGALSITRLNEIVESTEIDQSCSIKLAKVGTLKSEATKNVSDGVLSVKASFSNRNLAFIKRKTKVKVTCKFSNALAETKSLSSSFNWK